MQKYNLVKLHSNEENLDFKTSPSHYKQFTCLQVTRKRTIPNEILKKLFKNDAKFYIRALLKIYIFCAGVNSHVFLNFDQFVTGYQYATIFWSNSDECPPPPPPQIKCVI